MKPQHALVHAQRHIRILDLATQCAKLGARTRTIRLLTGLSDTQLGHLFLQPPEGKRRGRHPYSLDWYHTAKLQSRAEASAIVSLYRKLHQRGIAPPLALVGAYKHYLQSCKSSPLVCFDRAFDLVANATGQWLASGKGFSVFTCAACKSEYLTCLSSPPLSNNDCPFCKLLRRYKKHSHIPRIPLSPKILVDIQAFWILSDWKKTCIPAILPKSA